MRKLGLLKVKATETYLKQIFRPALHADRVSSLLVFTHNFYAILKAGVFSRHDVMRLIIGIEKRDRTQWKLKPETNK